MGDSWLSRLSTWVLGDPSNEGLQSSVGTYEELHSEVQRVLVPTAAAPGIQVNVTQALNRNFALSYRYV